MAALSAALVACGSGDGSAPASGSGSGSGSTQGAGGGSLKVPSAVGKTCQAGDAGALKGTRVPVAAGSPAGPAPEEPFYVDSQSSAAAAIRSDPKNTALYRKIASQPVAYAIGDWLGDPRNAVSAYLDRAAAAQATGILMVYAIPHRDQGAGYSAGGEATAADYRQFTRRVAGAIGDRRVVIILEPDSLAQMDSLTSAQQSERYALLRDAVEVYGKRKGASVYLDGANCGWTPAAVIAQRLKKAGVTGARGFAVNVANYYWRPDEVARGRVISALTGGSHFVVDTSRDGRGPAKSANAWCNPPGRGLGRPPTTSTGEPLADAYLWIKAPGESDGECGRGEPAAGRFWSAQALTLARNSTS
ncbi:MAG: glycoside hydrolase family 6 protein [Frankia sp.]